MTDRKAARRRAPVGFIVGGVAGGVLGWLVSAVGPLHDSPLAQPDRLFRSIILAFALLYVGVALHELAHVLAGRLVGFRFLMIMVGPVKVSRQGDRLQVRWHGKLGFSGGFGGCVPTDSHNLPRRIAIEIGAGPLSRLLLAVTASVAFAWIPVDVADGWAKTADGLLAFWGYLLFLISAYPRRVGGLYSDGALLLLLARGGPPAERYASLIALLAQSIGLGIRPRDLDPSLIAAVIALPDDSFHHTAGCSLAYKAALDRGEIEEAGRWIDEGPLVLPEGARI